MRTHYLAGVLLMEHEGESAVTNQGTIKWKNGKLEAEYWHVWNYSWTFKQIYQRAFCECNASLDEWMYLQFLLKVLTFKIPHIVFTWKKERIYK